MNCPCPQFDIQKYKDQPYQNTPCATCRLTKQTYKTNKHIQLYTTDGAQQDIQQVAAQQPDDSQYIPQNIPPSVIQTIQKACQQNMMVTLSNIVLKLCVMSKQYPALFEILILKMQHPTMSYYQIGRNMVPPCSKQNVLYHLERAVQMFPELCKSIITDTRFSGGKNAIRKVSDCLAKDKQINRVRRIIYEQSQMNTSKDLKELQQIFKMPYKIDVITMFDKELKPVIPPRKLKKLKDDSKN